MNRRVLLTGGSGLLGSHLTRSAPGWIAPGLEELDLLRPETLSACLDRHRPDTILHAAALTRTGYVNEHPDEAIAVNIAGTAQLAAEAVRRRLRLVYLSSDYVYADTPGPHREDEALHPLNNYAWSKLGGECAVRLVPGSLIIRTTFGPRPFPYGKATEDQLTSRLHVDEIAPLIIELTEGEHTGILNIGGPRRSILDYARQTRPDVRAVRRAEIGDPLPADSSLDLARWHELRKKS